MKTEIISYNLGVTTCYFIIAKDIVMIDAGLPGKLKRFKKILTKHKIDLSHIKLIVLTHSHFDHCGSAKQIWE
jgi:glyoxylase-like metal-dependent hydrolase (beta-lactamase superfamily II)